MGQNYQKVRSVLIFAVLGIVGGLIWFLFFSPFSPISTQKIATPQPVTGGQLQITEPEDSDVVTVQTLKISGKTKPGTFLVIANFADSQVLKISDSAEFALNLKLVEGYNFIKLTNFAPDGTSAEITLEVFFLSEKFEELTKSQGVATESGELAELTKRLTELRAKKRLKIVAGTVKGILGKNLALETKSGARTVVFEKPGKVGSYPDLAKNLDFTQIQAADFVVAVGSFAQQGILTARILLVNADKKPEFSKTAKFGIVEEINEDSLVLTNPLDGGKAIVSIKNAEILDETGQELKTENISVGNKLMIVGAQVKENFAVEKIMVIAGNFLGELEKFTTPPPATQSATPSAQ